MRRSYNCVFLCNVLLSCLLKIVRDMGLENQFHLFLTTYQRRYL